MIKNRIRLLLLILITIIGGAGCTGKSTEEKMLQYLEETYNEEFEIEFVNKGGGGLFSSTSSSENAVAHLKDDPNVVFTVRENKDKTSYNDSYLLARWGRELEKKFSQKIENELPGNADYRIFIHSGVGTFDKTMVDYDPEEFIEVVNGDLSIELKVSIKVPHEPDLNLYSEGIYNLFQMIQSLGSRRYLFSIGFVDENEDTTEFIRTSFTNNIGWRSLNRKVYGTINLDHRFSEEIRNSNDVVERYKTKEK
ncbi:hypothetical protein [Evansella cellulosilytica]|uniref:Lipoprotein n=1 Tax=Evansella cellulosilytica (strain ATCC 21833 / DSM 2522 / FERM P-1141 / JCM 9156 / N-4) TaxID=649639 RepID=E6TRG8_EVAC2|nr:hypothetical protein [Evansella cellulosilytica]ADU31798.1 hypothetical protein Bcell_3557 [Evansella cellulosilytica DSM 2522]